MQQIVFLAGALPEITPWELSALPNRLAGSGRRWAPGREEKRRDEQREGKGTLERGRERDEWEWEQQQQRDSHTSFNYK